MGHRVTYSPKVFIPLTMLCRDRCGYCTFAKPPARLQAPYLDPDEVLAIARAGAAAGMPRGAVHPGRAARGPLPGGARLARRRTATRRPSTTSSPCARWCATRPACCPTPTPARSAATTWPALRAGVGVAGDDDRVASIPISTATAARPTSRPPAASPPSSAAGELAIPFTTGILVGIGESRRDRVDALPAIAAAHGRHGHVQEVIVQNFLPKAGTAMHGAPPCPEDEYLWSVAAGAAGAAGRHPRAGPAQPVRRLRPPARCRHRRLGRRLAGHAPTTSTPSGHGRRSIAYAK